MDIFLRSYTTGSLAEKTGLKRDAVEHIIKTRHIKPVAVLGGRKIFDERALHQIGAIIAERQARKAKRELAHD
jgi:DNA-binding transcriptional MerR regulator